MHVPESIPGKDHAEQIYDNPESTGFNDPHESHRTLNHGLGCSIETLGFDCFVKLEVLIPNSLNHFTGFEKKNNAFVHCTVLTGLQLSVLL